jgi:hypothetical protein
VAAKNILDSLLSHLGVRVMSKPNNVTVEALSQDVVVGPMGLSIMNPVSVKG